LGTEGAGQHQHAYKDVFHSVDDRWWNVDNTLITNDFINTPNNLGSNGWPDHNNVGHQIDRITFNSGYHNHNLKGASGHSSANIAYTGGNQPFDNRPFFTVVQYIIYIQH